MILPSDIQRKYDESQNFLQDRKKRQVAQLVLINNLQRGDQNIASTMLITLFNRILSNLYDDKIQVKFTPGEEIDQKKINSLNLLAENDYREMNKARLDYDWSWDTLFFGRGYMETLRFNKKRKILEPHVINPLVFGYDPYFESVQQWRYYWKWLTKSKWDIIRLVNKGIITGITRPDEIPAGIDPYLWDYKTQRDQAKLTVEPPMDTSTGDVFQILEYYGYDENGDKCIYWTDRNISKVLMKEKLDLRDGEDKTSRWPIVVKEAFREPHSSVVFSVADLLEDKHRAKSVLLNLAFIAAKDKANPIYGYIPEDVLDLSQLFQRQITQHIPMKNPNAVFPLNTSEPMSGGLLQFISILNQEANDPVGTGMALQPAKKGKQSATETAIQQQLNDLAQSLQSKVMQQGEKDFWSDWYQRYKRYTKAGDEKMATIVGVKGMTFEKIDLGDIQTKFPPGVEVSSAKDAEYKELVLRRDLMQMYPQLQESIGPEGMRNFNKYVFFPKFLKDPSLVDIILPKTLDEFKAEEENESLALDKMPQVAETDDHTQHIYVHKMAKRTWSTWVHIAWHEELLAMQKKQEKEQQQQQGQAGDKKNNMGDSMPPKPKGSSGGGVQVKDKKKDPMAAASPLQNELQPKVTKQ